MCIQFLIYHVFLIYIICQTLFYVVGKRIDAICHGGLSEPLEIRTQATGTIRLFGTCMGATIRTRGSMHGVHISDHRDRSLRATQFVHLRDRYVG